MGGWLIDEFYGSMGGWVGDLYLEAFEEVGLDLHAHGRGPCRFGDFDADAAVSFWFGLVC